LPALRQQECGTGSGCVLRRDRQEELTVFDHRLSMKTGLRPGSLQSCEEWCTAPSDAFRRGLPLHAPKLETNEEFIAVRAKVRPVILIQPEAPLGFDNRGYRGTVDRHKCLVAQVFGLADTKTGRSEFSPVFVERVRKMEYPQLFFLPKRGGIFEVDSMLRLDELQSVFTPHLEPRQVALDDEVAEVLRYQFQFLWTGFGPSDYTDLRELVLTN
jgi:hypothetical protein